MTPLPPSSLPRCAPVDVVLASTQCQVSCLECGRDCLVQGLSAGQTWVSWCRSCHCRLAVGVEQCRFVLHQPGPQLAGERFRVVNLFLTHAQLFCLYILHTAPPTGTVHVSRKKEAKLQEGKPLPEFGTCSHYKKSHRWLRCGCSLTRWHWSTFGCFETNLIFDVVRFPCCGKAYPCDVCHDTTEDHPGELANRMICGYCSREQVGSLACMPMWRTLC